MSDIFNLPLEVRDDLVFFSKSDTCYAKIEGVASRKEELEVSSAIHRAVNNHDSLVEENQKLRAALQKIEKLSDNLLWRCVESDSEIAESDAWHELERAIKFRTDKTK